MRDAAFRCSCMSNDSDCLDLAITCLAGDALAWFHSPSVGESISSYSQFKSMLTTEYTNIEAESIARRKLSTLSQTSTVEAYVKAIRELLLDIHNICPKELLHKFLHGLKPNVRTHVALQHPSTFAQAVHEATIVENTTAAHSTPPIPPTPPPNPKPPQPQHTTRLNATTSHVSKPRAPITDEERAELNAKGGCTYCRQLGHTIASCPIRPPPKNGRPQ